MKTLLTATTLICICLLVSLQTSLTSCSKDPDTIIKHDTITVIKQDTMMTTAILTAHDWKVYEERGVKGGAKVYYLRGGSSNTESFDNEYLRFNPAGTGTHSHNNGTQVNMTWVFANPERTKINWTVLNTPATYTITWDNIRYKNGWMYFDQYYTDGNTGVNSHSQQIRMPK